jgi:hypothetical protein
MELVIIMLNKINQTQKKISFVFSGIAESKPKTKYDMNVKQGLFGWGNQ